MLDDARKVVYRIGSDRNRRRRVPTISLLMNSIALHTIPTMLENLPYAVRTSEFCVFS